jgi:hypothetical protein
MSDYVALTEAEAAQLTWHAKIVRLHQHWRVLHRPEGFPGRQDFEPTAVPDLLPHLWLVDVHRDPLRFKYRLIGTKVIATMEGGKDFTGYWLDEAHPAIQSNPDMKRRFEMAAAGIPTWRVGTLHFRHDREWITVQNVFLPLACDGKLVDMLLCGSVLIDKRGHEM